MNDSRQYLHEPGIAVKQPQPYYVCDMRQKYMRQICLLFKYYVIERNKTMRDDQNSQKALCLEGIA